VDVAYVGILLVLLLLTDCDYLFVITEINLIHIFRKQCGQVTVFVLEHILLF